MDSSDAIQFLILIILICLSAFFISRNFYDNSEQNSYSSFSRPRGQASPDTFERIEDSGKLLSTILIGNNIVNISASSLATTLTMRLFGSAAVSISTGIITLLVLIFGKSLQKLWQLYIPKNGTVLCKSHSHFNVHSDADYLYYQ